MTGESYATSLDIEGACKVIGAAGDRDAALGLPLLTDRGWEFSIEVQTYDDRRPVLTVYAEEDRYSGGDRHTFKGLELTEEAAGVVEEFESERGKGITELLTDEELRSVEELETDKPSDLVSDPVYAEEL